MDEAKGQRDAIARGNACRSPLGSGTTQASSRFPQKPAESGQNPAQSGSSRKAASTARIRGKRFVEHHALPPEWWKMGPVMAIVMLGNALTSASFPKLSSVVFCLLAIILALVSQVASRKEQEREVGRETASAFVGGFIGLPMLLFGTGMGFWFSQDNMIGAEVASLVLTTMICAIKTSGRVLAMVTAQIGLWLGFTLTAFSPVATIALLAGSAMGIYASRQQLLAARAAQKLQEQVERAHQRAELILNDFEQTRQGWFWETDRRGTITYVSPTIGEILGRDGARLIGRPFAELFILDEHSREGEQTLAFHMSTRSSFQELAVRAATKNGEERWWSINGLPIYDDYNNYQGFRGSGSDLTEKRRSEEKVIGASVGIAVAPFDGATSEELVRSADLALYAAKGGGRGQFRFFSIELQNNAEKRQIIEEDLRHALAQGQMRLDYQPIVSIKSNTVVGLEALMRWQHPDFGELPPSLFIPIAEESDTIVGLSEWAIHEACREAAGWPGTLPVSVNVATTHFGIGGFMATLTQALAESQLAPDRLELEFNETVFRLSEQAINDTLGELRTLGVKVSLDNFGAGASPLGQLRLHRFDKVKIDRDVVQDMTMSKSRCSAIGASIVTLAKRLGMQTVAVGVEARDELKVMTDLGIDLIQGHIYAPPCPVAEVNDSLATGQWVIEPDGPSRQRADRRSVYRRVGVIHEDFRYDVIMRNLSRGGAAIEGLFDVPAGTEFVIDLGEGQLMVATVRHSDGSVQGLEFESSLVDDGAGGLCTRHRVPRHLLEAMGMPAGGSTSASIIALNTTGGIHLPRFATAETTKSGKGG